MNATSLQVSYAYPTSHTASVLGYGKTGCAYILDTLTHQPASPGFRTVEQADAYASENGIALLPDRLPRALERTVAEACELADATRIVCSEFHEFCMVGE